MNRALALVVFCLVTPSAYAQDGDAELKDWCTPALGTLSDSVAEGIDVDRLGVAVTATGSLSLWGFPMVGPGIGVAARVRILDWLSVEPHADGIVESFLMIGVASLQLGVPIVVEAPLKDGMRTHVGLGPFINAGHVFGHDSAALGTFVGGELVAGVGLPLNDFLEARAQLRGHVAIGGGVPLPVNLGGSGTAGIMLTF